MKLFTILSLLSLGLVASANASVLQCTGTPGGDYLVVAGAESATVFFGRGITPAGGEPNWSLNFTGKVDANTDTALSVSYEPSREVDWNQYSGYCWRQVGITRSLQLQKNGATYTGTLDGAPVFVMNPNLGIADGCGNTPTPDYISRSARFECVELHK